MEESTYQQFIELLEHRVKSHTPQESILRAFEDEYGLTELDPLRDEICKCIFCGLPQAAVTLTNMLLEMATISAIEKSKRQKIEIDETKIDNKKYGKSDSKLGYRIEMLYFGGIITELQRDNLHRCRIWLRNTFSHADLKNVAKEDIPIKCWDLEKQTTFDSVVNLEILSMLKGIAFHKSAEENYITYFLYVDYIIRALSSKLTPSK